MVPTWQTALILVTMWISITTCCNKAAVQKNTTKRCGRVTFTQKFTWNSCSTPYLPFLSSNYPIRVLKAFPKIFPQKRSLLNAQQKKTNEARKAKEENKWKEKVNSLLRRYFIRRIIFYIQQDNYIWGMQTHSIANS